MLDKNNNLLLDNAIKKFDPKILKNIKIFDIQENHFKNSSQGILILKQIYNCGRMIKMFDLIQRKTDEINKGKFPFFYSWLWCSLSDSISLEAYKISEKLEKNLEKIFKNIKELPVEIKSLLRETSLLSERLDKLKKIEKGLKKYRHNRLAHFEIGYKEDRPFTFKLDTLFENISEIYNSISYIFICLTNFKQFYNYIESKSNKREDTLGANFFLHMESVKWESNDCRLSLELKEDEIIKQLDNLMNTSLKIKSL